MVLLGEMRTLRYDGGYSILKDYVRARRHPHQPQTATRFEVAPGERAQGGLGQSDLFGRRW